jgi:hypothetical protein
MGWEQWLDTVKLQLAVATLHQWASARITISKHGELQKLFGASMACSS